MEKERFFTSEGKSLNSVLLASQEHPMIEMEWGGDNVALRVPNPK
jgi:hypothetical protein